MKTHCALRGSLPFILPLFAIVLCLQSAQAGSATWNLNPGSTWNNDENWTPATIPNGPADIATFGVSNWTEPQLFGDTEVSAIVFSPGASSYTIQEYVYNFTISGAGIINNSGVTQNFTAQPQSSVTFFVKFANSASAGSSTVFTLLGGLASPYEGGLIQFFDNATADHGSFHLEGGAASGADGGVMFFNDVATAANASFVLDGGAVSKASGSFMGFLDNSSAGSASFTLNAGAVSGTDELNTTTGASLDFDDNTSAGDGSFVVNGSSVLYAWGGLLAFQSTATAANGTFVANGATVPVASTAGGGRIAFLFSSRAEHAQLSANGTVAESPGFIFFEAASTADTAIVNLAGYGTMDISLHDDPGLTVGSLSGHGSVFLGSQNLAVGSNNTNAIFSGSFHDGGVFAETQGSLTKIGTGTLTLSGASTYTGGTTVSEGALLINNRTGSGTGRGTVQAIAGLLGGSGKMTGSVAVGGGSELGHISPGARGNKGAGHLIINGALTFLSNGIYDFQLDSLHGTVDKLSAKSVTINPGARFSGRDLGSSVYAIGTVFTIIDNTAATPIAGTFDNLPDGAVIRIEGVGSANQFRVSYEGGDGNDLTLTATL